MEDDIPSENVTPSHRPAVRNPGQVLPFGDEDDVVPALQKKAVEDVLKQKRSLFVRMVSDPKLYNPKILKTRTPAIKSGPSFPPLDGHTNGDGSNTQQPPQHPSPSSSWISWPLAFMFNDIKDDEVGFRFRNWDSTLSIKPGPSGSSKSTSPDYEHQFLRPISPNPGRRSRSPSAGAVKSLTRSKSPCKDGKPDKA